MFKNRYMDDRDFARFACGDQAKDRYAELTGIGAPEMAEGSGPPEADRNGRRDIASAVLYALTAAVLLLWFFQAEPFSDIKESRQTDADRSGNRYAAITDVITYRGVTPGKEYTATATPVDKRTGRPYTDRHGNVIREKVTFVPEKPDGQMEIEIKIPVSAAGSP